MLNVTSCFNTCKGSRSFPPFNWPCSFYQLSLVRCCKVINWFWRRWWRRRVKGIKSIVDLLFIVFNLSCAHVVLYMPTEIKGEFTVLLGAQYLIFHNIELQSHIWIYAILDSGILNKLNYLAKSNMSKMEIPHPMKGSTVRSSF